MDKWMDGWMQNLVSNIGLILEDAVLSQPDLRNLDLGAAQTCMDFSKSMKQTGLANIDSHNNLITCSYSSVLVYCHMIRWFTRSSQWLYQLVNSSNSSQLGTIWQAATYCLHNVYWKLSTAHKTMHSSNCAFNNTAHWILHSVHFALHNTYYKLHAAVHMVHFTLHTIPELMSANHPVMAISHNPTIFSEARVTSEKSLEARKSQSHHILQP